MSKRYVQAPGVVVRQVDEDVFLTDPDSGTVHHIDPIGTAIWSLLAEPQSVPEIATLLQEAFPDTNKTTISRDLDDLIHDLLKNELIEEAESV